LSCKGWTARHIDPPSAPAIIRTLRREPGRQACAQVDGALHTVTCRRPVKQVRDTTAGNTHLTTHSDLVAFNDSGNFLRSKIRVMHAFQPVAVLFYVEIVYALFREVLYHHLPMTGDARRRRFQRVIAWLA